MLRADSPVTYNLSVASNENNTETNMATTTRHTVDSLVEMSREALEALGRETWAGMSKTMRAALESLMRAEDELPRGLLCSRCDLDDSAAYGLNGQSLGRLRKLGLAYKDHYGEWRTTVLAGWTAEAEEETEEETEVRGRPGRRLRRKAVGAGAQVSWPSAPLTYAGPRISPGN